MAINFTGQAGLCGTNAQGRKINLIAARREATTPWVRPSEWPALPPITASDEKLVGIYAVFPDSNSNYVAMLSAGNYTVNWGDGTVENYSSSTTASHIYDYNSPSLTTTSYGYKCAVVTLTPQAGKHLSGTRIYDLHPALNQTNNTGWLDVALSTPYSSSSYVGISSQSSSTKHRRLERVQILNIGSTNSFSYTFFNCSALRSVTLPQTPGVKTADAMFYNCYSLEVAPSFDTSQCTAVNSMFANCCSLKVVPPYNLSAATNLSYMFQGCSSLRRIPRFNTPAATDMSGIFLDCKSLEVVPELNTSLVTTLASAFSGCHSLREVPSLNTPALLSLSSCFYNCYSMRNAPTIVTSLVTNMSSMFSGCFSLDSVPAYDTAKVANMNSMFASCSALREIPQFNTPLLTNTASMFYGCSSLNKLPLFNTALVTNMQTMFYQCEGLSVMPAFSQASVTSGNGSSFANYGRALSSVGCTGIKYSVDYSSCGLFRSALETIFTNLGKAANTSQVINISSCTGADTAISKANCTTTSGSLAVTLSDTSSLAVGMICTGAGVSTGAAVVFQDAGDTVALTSHGLANGTMVSFSAITSTTGIIAYTNYWVINSTANTFQVAATQGGNAIALTTDGSGTLLYPSYITAITPNTSVTLSAPASANGTVTLSFRKLDTFKATSKGWSITG